MRGVKDTESAEKRGVEAVEKFLAGNKREEVGVELRLYKKQSVVVVWKRRQRRDGREAILIFWQTCES